MKTLSICISCLLLCSFGSNAQRYAVIDSKYILEKLPEYKEAQNKLDQFSEQWQQEIDQNSRTWIKCIKIMMLNR